MTITILDKATIGKDIDFKAIHDLGKVEEYSWTEPHEVTSRCQNSDVIITNKVVFDKNNLRELPKLQLICLTATGYNNIDLEAAKQHGVTTCNVRGYSTEAVTQHTFSLLFYLWEKTRYYDEYTKSGEYARSTSFTHLQQTYRELYGKTWGIVGLGAIGKRVAQIAQAFGCRVIYYSTSGANDNKDYKRVDKQTLCKESDIISIHSPLNEATKDLFRLEDLGTMKPESIIINVGRGGIINEGDLVDALNRDWIAGAGIDVLTKEPMAVDSPYFDIKDPSKLIITPHIAWAPVETRQRVIQEVARNIQAFTQGKPINTVSL